jgi:hypothetical protein
MKKARCMAAKFLRHIGDRPSNRIAIYAHCDREEHGEDGHHFVDGYGRTV